MDREAALHRLKDRHRYRPYVLPYLKLASAKVSVNTIKNKKDIFRAVYLLRTARKRKRVLMVLALCYIACPH